MGLKWDPNDKTDILDILAAFWLVLGLAVLVLGGAGVVIVAGIGILKLLRGQWGIADLGAQAAVVFLIAAFVVVVAVTYVVQNTDKPRHQR
jgi:membrane protein implicated in regulation of membrane protease activity